MTRDLHLSPTGCCGEGRGVVGPQLINPEIRFLIIIFMICYYNTFVIAFCKDRLLSAPKLNHNTHSGCPISKVPHFGKLLNIQKQLKGFLVRYVLNFVVPFLYVFCQLKLITQILEKDRCIKISILVLLVSVKFKTVIAKLFVSK